MASCPSDASKRSVSHLMPIGCQFKPVNSPPNTTPSKIPVIVKISSHPLAFMNEWGWLDSITQPYFAGEKTAAPRPAAIKQTMGFMPNRMAKQARHLSAFDANMTLFFDQVSEITPAHGPVNTKATVKSNFTTGIQYASSPRDCRMEISRIRSALSARELKNWLNSNE